MDFRISVIVPTYNRADLINETLNSILNQSHKAAEIIVVDDGSSDATEEVVRGFGPEVKYLKIENSGECRARNIGVDASSSPWIAFCDSDDLWQPEKLELQFKLFEANPDLDYSFTNFRTVVDGQWSGTTKFDSSPKDYWAIARRICAQESLVVEDPMFERLLVHQPIFPSTLMMKRSFFEGAGRWRESLGRTPSVDLEFHLRCVCRPPIGVVVAPVVGIRKHASNFSGDPLKTTLGEIEILRYALANNPTAKSYERAIEAEIVSRSASAARGAFSAGNFEAARRLIRAVPYRSRTWKLHVKNVISYARTSF